MKNHISNKFQALFQTEGEFFASAGRINLIGEHTDYNGGFVFPGAIDKGMIAEIKLNGTEKVRAFALDLDDYCEFGLNEEDAPAQSWARYIFGVCREIQKRGGVIGGFDTVFAGDVPLGAGMSSSAALESTFAYALNELLNITNHAYRAGNTFIPEIIHSVLGDGYQSGYDTNSYHTNPESFKRILPSELTGKWFGIQTRSVGVDKKPGKNQLKQAVRQVNLRDKRERRKSGRQID